MRGVLGNSSFRNLWLANLLSMSGSQISRVGLIIYVFNTRSSVLSLAILIILETLPGALVSPLAGALVDGVSKRAVMIVSDLARVCFMLIIVLSPDIETIYLMAALHSLATAFYQPAKAASIPLLVKKADRPGANGLDQSATCLTLSVGPIVGAELLLYFGLNVTLIVDSLSFLMSAILIANIKNMRESSAGELSAMTTIRSIKAGWNYLAGHTLALHVNLLFFVSLFCAGMWTPLAPAFVRDHLAGSSHVLGWQIGIFGFGAILGGLLAPLVVKRIGNGLTFFIALLAEGLGMSLYGIVSNLGISMLIMFVWGIVVSIIVVPFYSILQRVIEEAFLGRVFSVVKQGENFATVLAMVTAILLQDRLSSKVIFLLAGLFYTISIGALSLSKGGRLLLATR